MPEIFRACFSGDIKLCSNLFCTNIVALKPVNPNPMTPLVSVPNFLKVYFLLKINSFISQNTQCSPEEFYLKILPFPCETKYSLGPVTFLYEFRISQKKIALLSMLLPINLPCTQVCCLTYNNQSKYATLSSQCL